MAHPELRRSIIIIGGGIIGCTTAYYLTHHPSLDASTTTITLVEASQYGVAQGASGKAGGLVARWAYPKPLVDVSFEEHVRLAELHGGAERWGWRYVECGSWEGRAEAIPDPDSPAATSSTGLGPRKSLEKTSGLASGAKPSSKHKKSGLPSDLSWMAADLTDVYSPMAPSGDTAQVHPYKFTKSMMELSLEKGAKFLQGKVTNISISEGRITGVEYHDASTGESKHIPATDVILATGAWASTLIPSLPIAATRAHSITIHPPRHLLPIAPYVLFTEITLPQDGKGTGRRKHRGTSHASPEIYARPGPEGEVYACGPGDQTPLPPTVDEVQVDQGACEDIWTQVGGVSRVLRMGRVDKRQACFLPTVKIRREGPIVGDAGTVARGLVVGVGHTCWGICNAPGTARAIAELVLEGEIRCANLNSLQPLLFL